ncbi:MAG: hypothetical protein SFW62_07330 [Alphaproteobacteria bacterium]|nr:hypothetical protein [Alphaproteobacteria bacterium]
MKFMAVLSVTLSALLIAPAAPAHAANNLDPFQLDTGHWMSYQRYKEKADNPESFAQEAAPVEQEEIAAAPVEEPPKPVAPPAMPGMNKGYNVQINSTEDDVKRQTPKITRMESEPEMQLPSQSWQKADDAARRSAQNSNLNEEEITPLDIRMSMLPSLQAAAPPTRDNKKKMMTELIKAPPKPTDLDAAACAAIDAYKKRELDAIQRDRETLAALQTAISQLGLQKELSFLTDNNSKMNMPADNPVLSDAPGASPTLFEKAP